MPVEVRLPTMLRGDAAGQASVKANGGTVGEVIDDLVRQFPRLGGKIVTDDGSRIVWPGRSVPSRSAASTISSAMRSFTEPVGFWPSSFTSRRTRGLGLRRLTSTSGVSPIRSRIESSRATLAYPPATAGRIETTSSSASLVSSFSRYRTSSSLR